MMYSPSTASFRLSTANNGPGNMAIQEFHAYLNQPKLADRLHAALHRMCSFQVQDELPKPLRFSGWEPWWP